MAVEIPHEVHHLPVIPAVVKFNASLLVEEGANLLWRLELVVLLGALREHLQPLRVQLALQAVEREAHHRQRVQDAGGRVLVRDRKALLVPRRRPGKRAVRRLVRLAGGVDQPVALAEREGVPRAVFLGLRGEDEAAVGATFHPLHQHLPLVLVHVVALALLPDAATRLVRAAREAALRLDHHGHLLAVQLHRLVKPKLLPRLVRAARRLLQLVEHHHHAGALVGHRLSRGQLAVEEDVHPPVHPHDVLPAGVTAEVEDVARRLPRAQDDEGAGRLRLLPHFGRAGGRVDAAGRVGPVHH
mmetsp:Transcript_26490/g.56101  ORF Transcript_26490/g.56101 Transcript_26490/m.56101 type:complete len:300 (-) Transcript_26490:114-1013(-)